MPPEDAHFILEVRGSEGWIKLTGKHAAGVQVGNLELSASIDFIEPEVPVASGSVGPTAADFWTGAPINVSEVYASLAQDITTGTFNTPGFSHALHNSRLIAAVELAAQSGKRQILPTA